MPASTPQKRASSARRARPATPGNGRKSAPGKAAKSAKGRKSAPAKGAKNVSRAAKVTKAAASSAPAPTPKGLAKVAARKALKYAARKGAEASAAMLRRAVERVAEAGKGAVEAGKDAVESGTRRRPPIQFGVDVAVPIEVAWAEWLSYGSLPEGVHRVEDVERDGDTLLGRTAGPRPEDWEAEILDEREQESFAWRSIEGSDCAGLITFHRLSDRLTRIELDLDVLPTNPAEALALATRVADRRAATDLRKFKAHVEFINPDAYESDGRRNGKAPEDKSTSDRGQERTNDEPEQNGEG